MRTLKYSLSIFIYIYITSIWLLKDHRLAQLNTQAPEKKHTKNKPYSIKHTNTHLCEVES